MLIPGHVFHEACLLSWFKTQAEHYLANMHDRSMTEADVPAECPQCRTECYADPETGSPSIHRLFINFETSNPPSSQPSSSPARWNTSDKLLLGLARRAKALTHEVGTHSAESIEEDVKPTIGRIQSLQKDVASSKATSAFKGYIGGLTVAINKLRDHLEEHPFIPTLKGQLAASRNDYAALAEALPMTVENAVQAAVGNAVGKAEARADREVQKIVKERDVMQRDLEKEQVARVAAKRAAAEREEALNARLEKLESALEKERQARAELTTRVDERTRLLKMYQARAEGRKELKRKVEEQEGVIEALRAEAAKGSTSSRPEIRDYDGIDESQDPDDFDIPEPPDDSLIIDIEDEAPRAGRSTTARTFVCDLDDRRFKPKKQALPFPVVSRASKSTKSSSSKYFSDTPDRSNRVLVAASSPVASPKRPRPSIVDMTGDDSPEDLRAALRTPRTVSLKGDSRRSSSSSLLDFLGNGKQKGLVTGAKVKRRA